MLTRRDFLKLSSLAAGSLAFAPGVFGHSAKPSDATGLVRVGASQMRIYDQPSYQGEVVATRKKDQLIYTYEQFVSEEGPAFNPRWYRVDEGFAHTAYLQPVKTVLNDPVSFVRPAGEIFEVTVPITQSFRNTKSNGWEKLYRLYYASTHWVTGIEKGPDGATWYQITDELLHINYYVLANHLRKIPASELTPINPRIEDKRVEVSIAEQHLWAYEEGAIVLDTKISTGIPGMEPEGGIPTATPRGSFTVFSKMPVRHMGDGHVTADIEAYELPGVPWVSYFHEWGVAFHGTYWHDNYGNEMSHGCVNMKPEEAKWIFRWLAPESEMNEIQTRGHGSRVTVI